MSDQGVGAKDAELDPKPQVLGQDASEAGRAPRKRTGTLQGAASVPTLSVDAGAPPSLEAIDTAISLASTGPATDGADAGSAAEQAGMQRRRSRRNLVKIPDDAVPHTPTPAAVAPAAAAPPPPPPAPPPPPPPSAPAAVLVPPRPATSAEAPKSTPFVDGAPRPMPVSEPPRPAPAPVSAAPATPPTPPVPTVPSTPSAFVTDDSIQIIRPIAIISIGDPEPMPAAPPPAAASPAPIAAPPAPPAPPPPPADTETTLPSQHSPLAKSKPPAAAPLIEMREEEVDAIEEIEPDREPPSGDAKRPNATPPPPPPPPPPAAAAVAASPAPSIEAKPATAPGKTEEDAEVEIEPERDSIETADEGDRISAEEIDSERITTEPAGDRPSNEDIQIEVEAEPKAAASAASAEAKRPPPPPPRRPESVPAMQAVVPPAASPASTPAPASAKPTPPPSSPPATPPATPPARPVSSKPTPPPSEVATTKKRPWWEEIFSEDFLRTFDEPKRTFIQREVNFIEESLGVERGAVVLDVACGGGAHAVELATRGYNVVGLDLSLAMLARAADEAQERGQRINFMQGDMREMAFEETFDGMYSWGTSFGYFDEESNANVLQRMFRALRPGGLLLLDVVNRDYITNRQPSLVWFEGDGCVCMDEMFVDFFTSRLRVKRTVMFEDGRTREVDYSIRLYNLHEIGKMMHDAGFRVLQVTGHPAHPGVFFGAESPHVIVLAEKAG